MASQIIGVSIAACSGADQRKHQSPASLAFVIGLHRWPVGSSHKWPVTLKIFPFDDVIMNLFHRQWLLLLILTSRTVLDTERQQNFTAPCPWITNWSFTLILTGQTFTFTQSVSSLVDWNVSLLHECSRELNEVVKSINIYIDTTMHSHRVCVMAISHTHFNVVVMR